MTYFPDMENCSDSEDHVDIDGTSDDEYSGSEKMMPNSISKSPGCSECGVTNSKSSKLKPSFLITDILSDRKSQNRENSNTDRTHPKDLNETDSEDYVLQRHGKHFFFYKIWLIDWLIDWLMGV